MAHTNDYFKRVDEVVEEAFAQQTRLLGPASDGRPTTSLCLATADGLLVAVRKRIEETGKPVLWLDAARHYIRPDAADIPEDGRAYAAAIEWQFRLGHPTLEPADRLRGAMALLSDVQESQRWYGDDCPDSASRVANMQLNAAKVLISDAVDIELRRPRLESPAIKGLWI